MNDLYGALTDKCREVSLAGDSWHDTGHLPSSDPDTDEYQGRRFYDPADQLAVQTRRARTMVTVGQHMLQAEEGDRHYHAARRRRLITQQIPQPTIAQYDAAMSVLLTHGRQCVPAYDLPNVGECTNMHTCSGCGSLFYCGFIHTLIGCPFNMDSWAQSYNRRFPQKCNNCMSWTDHLWDYQQPARRYRNRGRRGLFYLQQENTDIDAVFDAIRARTTVTQQATTVVRLNIKFRHIAEDRAYYLRRARSLRRHSGFPVAADPSVPRALEHTQEGLAARERTALSGAFRGPRYKNWPQHEGGDIKPMIYYW
jgi:hypothetical protein